MIDQPGLKSLHIKVVHVPLERQWSLKLIVISHNARLISEGWYMYRFAFKCLDKNHRISKWYTTLESVKLKETYFEQVASTLHSSD